MRPCPHRRPVWVAVLSFPLVTACQVGPDYEEPEMPLPDQWHQAVTSDLEAEGADLRTWWTVFGDDVLNSLIDRAAAGNLDLEIAAARVREARALRRVVKADRLPTVDLSGEAGRFDLSRSNDPLDRGAYDAYALTFDASWELDVWGRVSRSIDAATADIQATEEALRDLLVLLYAEIAINYVDLRTSQARIQFATNNIESQRATMQITNDLFTAQLVPLGDVRQAEMNLARTQSALPIFRQNAVRSAHRIAVLLGQDPGAVYDLLNQSQSIPSSDAVVNMGIPADVLRRRPDIRQAERALAAQTARIGVAEANLYPQFALQGTFGWGALSTSELFKSPSQGWGISIPFRWNLFDRGRIKGDIAAQEARTEALQAGYERTVLLALEEVENAMLSMSTEGERVGYLQASADAATEAVSLLEDLYHQGLTDFQPVLDSQRTLAELQDALASSRGLVARNLIGLYAALGGGWDPLLDVEKLTDPEESTQPAP